MMRELAYRRLVDGDILEGFASYGTTSYADMLSYTYSDSFYQDVGPVEIVERAPAWVSYDGG